MEQLINTINNPWFFGSIAGLFVLYVLGLSVVLAIWTWRDIRDRSKNTVARYAAPLIVLVFGFAGFVPYLVLRPRMTFAERADERRDLLLLAEAAKKFECPTCFAAVEPDYANCPNCQAAFKPLCGCGAVIESSWKRCAYCGTAVAADLKSRQYAKPLPAVDLPPAIDMPAPKVAGKKSLTSKRAKAADKKIENAVTVEASSSTKPVAKLATKSAAKTSRLSFGGITGRFRRALSIKR